jgi:adenosylmethionine-8-amino-7-oxononanoate aminotransferase
MTNYGYPQGHLLYRNLSRNYPQITHGKGVYLFDESGKSYLDAAGGALVASVGHGNTEVSELIAEQLSKIAYVNGMHFTSGPAEELSERLSRYAAQAFSGQKYRSLFLCTGSEAVEAAIKFARQLHFERGHDQRAKLLVRTPSYHGNTLFALSASGRPHYQKVFKPLLSEVLTVSAPYEYRTPVKDYPKDGAQHYLQELEKKIEDSGPESIMGFLFEPVIGSSAGASLPPPGYFQGVQALCKKHGILTLADEILCGSGRTGSFFASEPESITPDILVLGKGLAGGYAPLSAILVKEEHLEEIQKGSGNFMHAQTYLHHAASTAAGCAVLRFFERNNLLENAQRIGTLLHQKLHEAFDSHPQVGRITGRGLLAGMEFVENPTTKKPFSRTEKYAEKLVEKSLNNGLTLWPNVGQADGVNGDLVVMGPPLTLTAAEAEELIHRLKLSLPE